jgi:hypothetical protein
MDVMIIMKTRKFFLVAVMVMCAIGVQAQHEDTEWREVSRQTLSRREWTIDN